MLLAEERPSYSSIGSVSKCLPQPTAYDCQRPSFGSPCMPGRQLTAALATFIAVAARHMAINCAGEYEMKKRRYWPS